MSDPDQTYDLQQWMTAEEVASWLKVSTRVISRIPHVELSGKKLYNRHTVGRWLSQHEEE